MNLSIDVSLMSDIVEDQDEDDPDYEPEFEMTAVLGEEAEGLEEMEFNMEQEKDEDVEGVRKIKDKNECESIVCLSFVDQLQVLAKTNITKGTSELEVFHQLILRYCAKRFAYSPPVYKMRNRLAAIDHNYHVDRPLKRNKNGEIRYYRCFVKKSNRWSVFPEKEKKDYGYVKDLKKRALEMRLDDRIGMKKTELEADDPRRISSHLSQIEVIPTRQLVEEKKSRFEVK